MKNKTGTITLRTTSQVALWNNCITGQLSDGYWENARPLDHWRFWINLEVRLGTEAKVEAQNPYAVRKTNYNLFAPKEFILEDMLQIGRMGCAGATDNTCRAALYMPATFEEFLTKKENGGFACLYIANDGQGASECLALACQYIAKCMEGVSHDLARAYYATEYTERDLNRDLKSIKEVMKTVEKR